ncbi:hypothetical protein TVAG_220950 [Trichomonas vaginalis G3]|uniref:Uncharacterized protein n=1 Tax=Trichomonas vaginalis (strain ATCC PRA-98 / G3) TaxID=412133 RepID=A2FV65_TRIV3|nr:hypothetical protein TVAGG3_0501040 [Trichomonas vaginalis G3]EAX91201.1 hypothetical protein TVAG_220950 [Trichomonas vaginalis G3]KAI5517081.1 hypothetical protein TVAGG3_0501040 [Trichomonas vaginalis G3]|eukprot:XP_001304131.1 hypothetical protein [Trichomonas vaginalis G3]
MAGCTPEEIQSRFVKAITPYKEFIDQFQAALLLKNIKFFVAIMVTVIGLITIFGLLIRSSIPNLVVAIIAIPILELFYCFDAHLKVKKLYIAEIPQSAEGALDRLWTLEEIIALVWKPALMIWRFGFFVYATFVCPNPVDTIAFILMCILLSFVNKFINFFVLFSVLLVLALVAPAILVKTPAGEKLREFLNKKKEKAE